MFTLLWKAPFGKAFTMKSRLPIDLANAKTFISQRLSSDQKSRFQVAITQFDE